MIYDRWKDDAPISHRTRQPIPRITLRYPNPRVDALLSGHVSIDSHWTARDFLDLALAALDQAGASVALQRQVRELVDGVAVVGECACGTVFHTADAAGEHECELGGEG